MPLQSKNARKRSEISHQRHLLGTAGVNGTGAPLASGVPRGFWRSPEDKSSRALATPKHVGPWKCASRLTPDLHGSRTNGGAEEEAVPIPRRSVLPPRSSEGYTLDPVLVRKLKQAILSGPRFDAAEADVARDLGLSARTLRRRLHSLGTTYAQTIAEVRFAFARQCLADPQLTIGDVADRLGYTEVSNFRNAFKRWAHVSPRAFRDLIGLTSAQGEARTL